MGLFSAWKCQRWIDGWMYGWMIRTSVWIGWINSMDFMYYDEWIIRFGRRNLWLIGLDGWMDWSRQI